MTDIEKAKKLLEEKSASIVLCRGGETAVSDAKGWCLVCVDGYSLGWGKLAGGILKNHYPKGLRKG